MNTLFQNPNVEVISGFLTWWVNKTPRYVKHDHGLCIVRLDELLKNSKLAIIDTTPESIHVQWKTDNTIQMDLYIMNDSLTIRDYTYIIPPFYECTIKI